MKRNTVKTIWLAGAVLSFGALTTGCDVGDKTPEVPHVQQPKVELPTTVAEAGIASFVDQSPEQQAAALAQKRVFVGRADAFALLPSERAFDRQQTVARLASEGGGFMTVFAAPVEEVTTVAVTEPLPNWRLSGVVIGDGVAALLDMGSTVVDIRPGQKVADTEWTVVSIDAERAVLRRDNGKLPRYFVVPLSSANEGANAPSGGGGGGNRGGGSGKLGPGTLGGGGAGD